MKRYEALAKAAEAIWTEVDGPLGKGVYPAHVTGRDRELLRAEAVLDAVDYWGAVEERDRYRAALERAGRALNRAGWVDESQAVLDTLRGR